MKIFIFILKWLLGSGLGGKMALMWVFIKKEVSREGDKGGERRKLDLHWLTDAERGGTNETRKVRGGEYLNISVPLQLTAVKVCIAVNGLHWRTSEQI
ncbi:MAG: hypothetical protein ACXWDN_02825 [Limisphaerales bacterium]